MTCDEFNANNERWLDDREFDRATNGELSAHFDHAFKCPECLKILVDIANRQMDRGYNPLIDKDERADKMMEDPEFLASYKHLMVDHAKDRRPAR